MQTLYKSEEIEDIVIGEVQRIKKRSSDEVFPSSTEGNPSMTRKDTLYVYWSFHSPFPLQMDLCVGGFTHLGLRLDESDERFHV